MLWNMVIFSRKSACFFFSTSSSVPFFNFFTNMGVKLLDITFSIIKGDRLVIGKPLDFIIMNLGKVDSTSLSEEESDST